MKLSIAIPVYNEAEALPLLLAELRRVLAVCGWDYEILFVNDGSRDTSLAILAREARADPRIKILTFSRNFGQQTAVTAGLDFATGDAVVIMDADLQDPPDLLPEMLELYRQGYEVVSPQRLMREGETWFKRKTASFFYALIRRISGEYVTPAVGEFRLLSRAAVLALRELREQHRFVRGMVGWLGLREAILPFDRQARAAGDTKYSLSSMLRLSWVAVTSLSALPLQLTMLTGLGASGLAVLYFFYAAFAYLRGTVVPGWTSIVFLQCFFFGVTLLSLGILGQYVARIYDEAKSRPLYVLSGTMNLDPAPLRAPRTVLMTARDGQAGDKESKETKAGAETR